MASLTYDVFAGVLAATTTSGKTKIAFCGSGFSNFAIHSGIKAMGASKDKDHTHGGPIPSGIYHVKPTGSHHKDGGKYRPQWHVVEWAGCGKFQRTHLYIHPKGTHTDGCIAVPSEDFKEISRMIDKDGGATLIVRGGMNEEVV